MELNDNGCFEFAMGDFTAEFPIERSYAKNHMWASQVQPDRWRFGLTAYAVRLLQDVYFLDWIVEPVSAVAIRAHIGSIESKKAESDLFSPLQGDLVAINEAALADPSVINADCYGDGWMIEMTASLDAVAVLLNPSAYAEHLVKAWDIAQKTIKGQANT
jgi:glycine cleavage system H protein